MDKDSTLNITQELDNLTNQKSPNKPINKTNILIALLIVISLIGITGIYQLKTINNQINQSTINTNDIGIKLNGNDINKQAIIVIPANIQ